MDKKATLSLGALVISIVADRQFVLPETSSGPERLSILRSAAQSGDLKFVDGSGKSLILSEWPRDGQWNKPPTTPDPYNKAPA